MANQISGTFTIIIRSQGGNYTIEANGPKNIRVALRPAPELKDLLSDQQIAANLKDLSSQAAPITPTTIQKLGNALYDSLFDDRELLLAFGKVQGGANADNGVRLKLQIEPAELTALPWETLHDGNDWVSTQSILPLVRKLDLPENRRPLQKLQIRGALRILFVGASPADLEPLKVEKTADELESLLAEPIKKKRIVFDKLLNATLDDVRKALLKDYHIVYFAGHGSPEGIFLDDGQGDVETQAGKKVRTNGDKSLVSAETLAEGLRGKQTRLVFLAACETSKTSEGSRLMRGFAQDLADRANLPAIVAMQYFISDMQANPLTTQFFAALAAGRPVDTAMAEARAALIKKGQVSRDVFSPVLYLQANDGALFPKAKNLPAILLGLGLSIALVIGVIFARSAQINQMQASIQASQNILAGHVVAPEAPEALINSLQAAKTLSDSPLLRFFKPDPQLQEQVSLSLQEAVYQVREHNRINIPKGSIQAVFSPNGRLIATVQVDGTVSIWDQTGRSSPQLNPIKAGGQVSSIGFTPDSQQLITVVDQQAKWWDLNGQQIGSNLDLSSLFDSNNPVIAPNGKSIEYSNGLLKDLESGTWLTQSPSSGTVYNGAFSPDGKLFLMPSFSGTAISIVDAEIQNKKIADITDLPFFNSNIPVSVRFSPDSRFIAAGGYQDDTIYLWDLKGNQLVKFRADQAGIVDMSFSPDGTQMATIGNDSTLRIWQNLEGKKFKSYSFDQASDNVGISANGQLAVVSTSDGIVSWDLQAGQQSPLQLPLSDVISELHFSADGHSLAVVEYKGNIHLVDLEQKQVFNTFMGNDVDYYQGTFTQQNYGRFLQGLSLSNSGDLLALGGSNSITVYSRNGKPLKEFKEGPDPEQGEMVPNWVQATAFDPNNSDVLATATVYGKVRLWNWKEGKELLSTPINANSTQTFIVVFSPNGNEIATAGFDGTPNGVRLWNRSGQKLAEFTGHIGKVSQVIFSPDGSLLATAGLDGTARIWNLAGQELKEYKYYQNQGNNPIQSIAFSQDGKQLVIAHSASPGSGLQIDFMQIESLDNLFAQGCEWIGDYLENNTDVSKTNKHLCDKIVNSK
jgi:WD40 repeat protein/CHAT domain-containing protein